jgi:hypothetical protein
MKIFIAYLSLVLACHKAEKAAPAPGSGGSALAVAVAQPPSGSTATGSAVPAPMSELAKAIDDIDRRLAPIWRLSDKERFAAFCAGRKLLLDKSAALITMPNPATDWRSTAEGLSNAVRMADKCCLEQPKDLSPALQAGQDDTNAECIKPIHDDFVAVAKLVPVAPAVDGHANDPVTK